MYVFCQYFLSFLSPLTPIANFSSVYLMKSKNSFPSSCWLELKPSDNSEETFCKRLLWCSIAVLHSSSAAQLASVNFFVSPLINCQKALNPRSNLSLVCYAYFQHLVSDSVFFSSKAVYNLNMCKWWRAAIFPLISSQSA